MWGKTASGSRFSDSEWMCYDSVVMTLTVLRSMAPVLCHASTVGDIFFALHRPMDRY